MATRNTLIKRSANNQDSSQLNNIKIHGLGGAYISRLNIDEMAEHNRPTTSQITMNSKYPFHIHNGLASYYSGTCTGTFVDQDEDCYVTSNSKVTEFNLKILEWLHDDTIKYLEFTDGTTIPVGITETVELSSSDNNNSNDKSIDNKFTVTIKFSWEQLMDI